MAVPLVVPVVEPLVDPDVDPPADPAVDPLVEPEVEPLDVVVVPLLRPELVVVLAEGFVDDACEPDDPWVVVVERWELDPCAVVAVECDVVACELLPCVVGLELPCVAAAPLPCVVVAGAACVVVGAACVVVGAACGVGGAE